MIWLRVLPRSIWIIRGGLFVPFFFVRWESELTLPISETTERYLLPVKNKFQTE